MKPLSCSVLGCRSLVAGADFGLAGAAGFFAGAGADCASVTVTDRTAIMRARLFFKVFPRFKGEQKNAAISTEPRTLRRWGSAGPGQMPSDCCSGLELPAAVWIGF